MSLTSYIEYISKYILASRGICVSIKISLAELLLV